jgi:hypothetical protein
MVQVNMRNDEVANVLRAKAFLTENFQKARDRMERVVFDESRFAVSAGS